MTIWYNQVRVRIDLQALLHNYDVIKGYAANPAPIVKSDAYGHGLKAVAPVLAQAGATTMGAGTVYEAAVLKEELPNLEVISLLGPLEEEDYPLACEKDLIVFVSRTEQLLLLEEEARRVGAPMRVALKFDTGMSRLGFSPGEAAGVAAVLDGLEFIRASLVCSHLATADDPDQKFYVQDQAQRFEGILQVFNARGLAIRASLANSGAVFGFPNYHYDLQRPGIGLYGGNPFYGSAWEDLVPKLAQAMSVTTKLIQIRTVTSGQSVSYGRTFVSKTEMRIGIVAVGYADNYSRGLSSKGWMYLRGQRVPVLGRVCMQLTAIDLTHVPDAEVGDDVYLLGGDGPQAITVDELAAWWGTITYEVFCLLGQNPREYVGQN